MHPTRTGIVTVLFLLAAGPLTAQGSHFALFAGVQPGGSYSDQRGVDSDFGWSFGAEVPVRGAWSAELMVFLEDQGALVSESEGASLELGDQRMVDASVRYRLGGVGNWAFLGGLGLRYGHRAAFGDASSRELWTTVGSLGADWQLTRRFSLRLEARHSLVDLSGDSQSFGERTFTTGLSARF